MEENMELLKKLTQTTAVSGSENAVISIIKNEIKKGTANSIIIINFLGTHTVCPLSV